jgi:hypothetical protein
MSTTPSPEALPRTLMRYVPLAAATLALWFGGLSALALFIAPKAVVAFGPTAALYRAVAESGAPMLAKGPGYVTVATNRPGAVLSLYRGGALFVWPIVARSCGGAI